MCLALEEGGGGVALISCEHYAVKSESSFTATSFESLSVLATVGSYALRIVVIYRVPPSKQNKLQKSAFVTELADLLEEAATWTGKLILLGDFNIHWYSVADSERQKLSSLLDSFGLCQHVEGPTHTGGHTLDLVISRTVDDLVSLCTVSDFISDHNAVLLTLNCGKRHPHCKIIT